MAFGILANRSPKISHSRSVKIVSDTYATSRTDMKQYLFLIALTFFGVVSSFWWTPYAGVALYYFYAILRPQFLWKWTLDYAPVSIPWSFCVAGSAIFGYISWSFGILSFGKRESSLMRYRPAFTLAHKLMMLFAFWIICSYARSNDQAASEEWFGEYLKIFAMYYLASRVVRTPTQIWGLFMLIVTAVGYIAYEANMIYLQTGKLILYSRGFAGLDNNGAGLMLALGVPLCYFAWEMTKGWYRYGFLILIPIIVHAVLGTYSRGAMGSMIVALPFYFLYTRYKKFFAFLLLCGLFALPFMAGKEIQDRFFSIEKREVDSSYQARQLSWKIAQEIAWDYPIFGAGIRCSNKEMKQRGADMEGRTIHMLYLQIAADSGWIALLIYVSMVGATFISIWRARRRLWRRTDPESMRATAILGGIECSLISFLVGATFLSLEVFEISYLLFFIGTQIWALLNATDTMLKEKMPGQWHAGNRYPLPNTQGRRAQQPMPPRGPMPRPMPQEAPANGQTPPRTRPGFPQR